MALTVHRLFWRLMLLTAVFLLFQTGLAIVDPDSYYHARLSSMQVEGLVRDLPALPLTILGGASFVDHHYLYHLIVGLFIKGASWLLVGAPSLLPYIPLATLKASTALFAAAFVTLFWTILDWSKVERSWRWIVVLLTTGGWLFRVNLSKAQPLALILLFIGLWLIWGWMDDRRNLEAREIHWRSAALAVFSFLYVWLYDGWVVWVLLVGVGAVVAKIQRRFALAVVIGTMLGLIINPYFPSNLWFSWFHIVKIGLFKDMPSDLVIGSEWYAPGVADMLSELAPLFLAALLFLIVLLKETRPRWSPLVSVLLVSSVLLLLFSLQSRRHYEYAVPIAIWFLALTARSFTMMFGPWFSRFQKIIIVTAVAAVMVTHVARVASALHRPVSDMRAAQGAAQWLTSNVRAESMIVLESWDLFPLFWYYAPQFVYPGGLDARFLWYKDSALSQRWWNMANGKSNNIAEDMKTLGSTVAVVTKRFLKWKEQLGKDERFTLRYADERFSIFVLQR